MSEEAKTEIGTKKCGKMTGRATDKRGAGVRHRLQIKIIPVDFISPDSFISRWVMEFDSTNCIVIWRKDVAVVVDPGGEAAKIVRFLKLRKLTVGAYWLTHAHPDHTRALPELLKEFPAPVRYHCADSGCRKTSHPCLSIRKSKWFHPFGDIRKIACGDIVAKVILTPGHTKGGVCYLQEDLGVLLTGDTCAESETCFGGNEKDLRNSLRRVSRRVADEIKVVPGHGEMTTIGRERLNCLRSERKNGLLSKFRRMFFTSFSEMEAAFNKVRKELEKLGLLVDGSPLDGVECYHERFSLGGLSGFRGCMGFYDFKDRNIHVPAFYPPGLFPMWYGERQMLDVLRHEFGHALADRYAKFFRGGIFKTAFGASYGEKKVFDGEDWESEYVSKYATTATQEDFAETFMLYMKHKGKMPVRYSGKRAIGKKWKTVGRIIREIAALEK